MSRKLVNAPVFPRKGDKHNAWHSAFRQAMEHPAVVQFWQAGPVPKRVFFEGWRRGEEWEAGAGCAIYSIFFCRRCLGKAQPFSMLLLWLGSKGRVVKRALFAALADHLCLDSAQIPPAILEVACVRRQMLSCLLVVRGDAASVECVLHDHRARM